MKVSILIPTFNRLKNLSRCIDSAVDFSKKSRHEIDIHICDNLTNDGTNEFLKKAACLNSNIKPFRRTEFIPSGHENLVRWLESIPNERDWYWVLGDDDVLISENTEYFDNLIEMNGIDYIHVPTPDLILNQNLIVDKVSGLVDFFGLIEIFSFFSNQIISKASLECIKQTIYKNNEAFNYEYCFIHALTLFIALEDKIGAISNFPLVNYQDGIPSNNSGIPWFDTAENLILLNQKKLINLPRNKEFFLSRGNLLWRMFTQWVILNSINTKTAPSKILEEKIKKTINLCNDQELAESDALLVDDAFFILEILFNEESLNESIKIRLKNQIINIYNRFGQPFKRI
jgi:glycosyltransferase involved in cell wall biosynthesis